MRLAVVTNAFPPRAQGGAGQVAADLVRLWEGAGHEVRVWTERATWLDAGPLRRLLGHLWNDRVPMAKCAEIVDWQPDAVITHNLTGCGWSTGKHIRARLNIPWVHVLHDVQLFEPSGWLWQDRVSWWQRFWSWYRKGLVGAPTLVVSPSQWLLEAHRRRGVFLGTSAQVIPNPAPTHSLEGSPSREGWVFVANQLSEAKGVDMVYALADALPEERFVLIGSAQHIKKLDASNAVHLGSCSREEVLQQVRKARGLLVPSRICENQPTTILEALSLGTPVIGTAAAGIPEAMEGGGIAVPLSVESWVSAMHTMKQDQDGWVRRATLAAERFTPQAVQRIWSELFVELAGDASNSYTHTRPS